MRDKSQVVLPIDLEINIKKNDFVFTLAQITEKLNYEKLFSEYVRKWRKINPITLFEIILFAYMERKFSSREIVKACHTDIRFMWLLNGEPAPSVATVKRFLSEKLTDVIEDLFYQDEYEKHFGRMKDRNSYSKTDIDATFMRMKDDYMRNGQLKPGYNIQIGVESEYIVGFGAFSNRTDVQTLIPFLERIKKSCGKTYKNIIADAGYESRENYEYLAENDQESYIKPINYEISKTRKYKTNPYCIEDMKYDEDTDSYICANGDILNFAYEKEETTEYGYKVKTKYYRNKSCEGCPYAGKCHKSKRGFRELKVSPEFLRQRKKSLENIISKEGTKLRVNRSIQVEGVFGILKQDFGFKRFLMRGKRNIETQFFLLAFAFNVEKLCNKQKHGRFGQDLFPLKTG